MMRCIILLLISFLSFATHAFSWQDLWFTPDQQGRDLMAKNQFKQAKETFTRSDWAAAAAYRAGDYPKAAELYQDLKNEQGYYNQGNALAHMGQYEEAIKAYDSALAINATNQDALYNRKLVQELLKKDKEKNQNKEQQNKEQQNKEQQNKEQQNKEQQNKEQQNKEQQNKEQQNKEQQNKEQQNKEQQNKEQQNKEQQNKEQQNKEQQNKEQQNKEQQNTEQQNKEQQNKEQQNKEQQNKEQQNKEKNKKYNQNNNEAQSEAEREKQQAKEQWLRLIPDDPGGLMREKFLRDHLRRERGWYQ
ncbi:tetratricopeptide repeat protein [Legionella parisiensis]|uniref:tetratricopeptide repeat protein n=2 Tax=Legionella parisiensis TaxID=45071 RepID=UPI000E042B4F|nr:tetratricopeptide repeat protein [Legionella parisiensis]STX71627.1 TPR repeat containing protein [Legionella parisiensis]